MSKKQLVPLFICSLIPWSVGNGLIPLLPVYAGRLGANPTVTGFYLAFAFITLTLGALSAGWVSDGFHRRKLPLIIAALVMIPVIWLIGQVHTLWGLTALTALLWFLGGLELALISILAGMSAGENERGKVFGILAVTNGLGAVVGALAIGWLVDRWGYSTMFQILATFTILFPAAALPLEEKDSKQTEVSRIHEDKSPGLGRNFYWLFAAIILSSIPGNFALLIRSLVMHKMGFNSLEITSTGAIAGLIAMPFPFLMGWISDRIGRKTFLYTAFLFGFASFVMLAFSTQLWHFLVTFASYGIGAGAPAIWNALVIDLVPREAIGKGLSSVSASQWIGGVIGYASAGVMLQGLGLGPTFIVGGFLALAAVVLLIPIRTRSRQNGLPNTGST
jgi:MFS family permease